MKLKNYPDFFAFICHILYNVYYGGVGNEEKNIGSDLNTVIMPAI